MREMERVFSVEEIPDPFWPPSPAAGGPPAAAAAGHPMGSMNRSPSEWFFEKFLEETAVTPPGATAQSPVPPPPPPPVSRPCSNPSPNASVSSSRVARDDEVVEIKRVNAASVAGAAVVAAQPHPSDAGMPAGTDPEEYIAHLKQKLDMYCAAVAMTRGSGPKPQESASYNDSRSQSSDPAQLGSQVLVKGNSSKVRSKADNGMGGLPAQSLVPNTGGQAKPATSGSSREQSDDDELEGETETTENTDTTDVKRVRRMLSNRESARRSRRRKQAHLSELESQVSQLRVENSSLLKKLTDINQRYSEAAVDNRVLKADVETLRAKVKMAEDTVKRVTGISPMFPTMSDMSSISMPFTGSPSEASSDAAVPIQDDPNHFFQAPPQDRRISNCIPEMIPTTPPAEDAAHGALAGGKMGRTASMQRVASLEHLQKRICGGPSSGGHDQWEATVWGPDTNKKQN